VSRRSDDLITKVARNEHRQLEKAVIRAVKAWRYAQDGKLARESLKSAIDVLTKFEDRYKDRLNA
jgi:hypothetical protein